MTRAEIITIGDEILYGQTLDTNSHWISGVLDEIHIKVHQKTTIGDDAEHILTTLKEAEERADLIIITGGLGPTKDDLTKPLLAQYFDVGMTLNEDALAEITRIFEAVGREVTEVNRKQAELPTNCEKITNRLGTAPGMWFEERGKVFLSLPGVPFEMKAMMKEEVLPKLQKKFGTGVIYHKVVRTIGIGESHLAETIAEWEDNLPPHIKLAYLPTLAQVKLRLTASGDNQVQLEKEVDQQVRVLLPLIEKYVFGYDDDEIQTVVGRMLKSQNATISTAESCTGGYLASMITSVRGSSAYYKGSVISYADEIKVRELGVSKDDLEKHGAVSEIAVKTMAENIRKKLSTDVGLSVSGIAGPDGGTPEKPVGTVWLGYSDRHKTLARKVQFTKNRDLNIKFAAIAALNLLRLNFSGD